MRVVIKKIANYMKLRIDDMPDRYHIGAPPAPGKLRGIRPRKVIQISQSSRQDLQRKDHVLRFRSRSLDRRHHFARKVGDVIDESQ